MNNIVYGALGLGTNIWRIRRSAAMFYRRHGFQIYSSAHQQSGYPTIARPRINKISYMARGQQEIGYKTHASIKLRGPDLRAIH